MKICRLSTTLDQPEFDALVNMALADCRHPREQLRFLLRQEAQRRGLLPAELPSQEFAQQKAGGQKEGEQDG